MKRMQERFKVLKEYVTMIEDKTNEKTWTSRELKTAIRALKVDNNGKVPTLEKDLVIYYKCIKERKNAIIAKYNRHNCNGAING